MKEANILKNFSKGLVTAYILAAVVITTYMLLAINRYLPVQEGWAQYCAGLVMKGKFPYRDFFYYLPPGYLYFFVGQYYLFGDNFLAYRMVGILERILIACLMINMFKRYFDVRYIFIAVIVGFFAYAGFNIDNPQSHYQTVFLSFILALYFLNKLTETESSKSVYLYAIFVGLCTANLVLMKQSLGLICLVGISVYVMVLGFGRYHLQKVIVILGTYSAVVWSVLGLVLLWLKMNGALEQFWIQVFATATSKGKLTDVLINGVLRTIETINTWRLGILVGVAGLVVLANSTFGNTREPVSRTATLWIILLFVFMITYFIPLQFPLGYRWQWSPDIARIITAIMFCITVLIWIINGLRIQRGKVFAFLFYMSFWALLWMYGHSTSGLTEIHAVWLAVAIMMLVILQGCRSRWVKCSAVLAGLMLVLLVSDFRYKVPYAWWGWCEPDIRQGRHKVAVPAIKYFRLSENTRDLYQTVYGDVISNTTPQDEVYVFPHMLIFNVMTDRWNSNFVPVAWFDVCSDEYAISAANWVQTTRPKMIINMVLSQLAIDTHEKLFRKGKPCGQRKIIEVIDELARNGDYIVIRKIEGKQELAQMPIEIMLRK